MASRICHNMCLMGHHHEEESAILANLRQPMPFRRKLWLVLYNNAIKLKNRQNCCGNLGQPGC